METVEQIIAYPWNIGADGRQWTREEIEEKYYNYCPDKIELIEGRMFWSDEQRLAMLALLLENVGVAAAVRLGDPSVWKDAVKQLGK